MSISGLYKYLIAVEKWVALPNFPIEKTGEKFRSVVWLLDAVDLLAKFDRADWNPALVF
jgi:hypothetical protein